MINRLKQYLVGDIYPWLALPNKLLSPLLFPVEVDLQILVIPVLLQQLILVSVVEELFYEEFATLLLGIMVGHRSMVLLAAHHLIVVYFELSERVEGPVVDEVGSVFGSVAHYLIFAEVEII